jgi:hypothetical protein
MIFLGRSHSAYNTPSVAPANHDEKFVPVITHESAFLVA